MSFKFESQGFLRRQRDAQGEFTDGDTLPEFISDATRAEVEFQNPGCGDLAADAYLHARDVAHGIGDPNTASFRIIVNGHFNDGSANSAKTFVQMGVQIQ